MYNPEHYEQEGVLVNHRTRLLMFVLEICQRHLLNYLFKKAWIHLEARVDHGGKWKILRDLTSMGPDGLIEEGRLFMFMLFVLGWNKHFNLVDTILKNQYAYTFENKNHTKVDYRIEGYMLLAVFVVKLLKFVINSHKQLQSKKRAQTIEKKTSKERI